MTEYMKSILQRDWQVQPVIEKEKHLLYQLIIQHGLTVDESPPQSDLILPESHDRLNETSPASLERRKTINEGNFRIFSDLFYEYFQPILKMITNQLDSFLSDENLHQQIIIAPSHPMLDSVKECLSALSYLLSGLWISENMKRHSNSSEILSLLLSNLDESIQNKLEQCLIRLTSIHQEEMRLIIVFLLSKQQAPSLFLNNTFDWLQFLHGWILSCCNLDPGARLYQQINIFTVPDSSEFLHGLEGIEKLLFDLQREHLNGRTAEVIPSNFVTFFLNQFYHFADIKFGKQALHPKELPESIESVLISTNLERLVFNILLCLPESVLSSHSHTLISRYNDIATKFSSQWTKPGNGLIDLRSLESQFWFWKVWVHLIMTSLKGNESNLSIGNAFSTTGTERTNASAIPTKEILALLEPLKKQNLPLLELSMRLQQTSKEQVAVPNLFTSAVNLTLSQRQLLIKLIIAELIAPSSGVGILVAPLQPLMKSSRQLTIHAYYTLTRYLIQFQTWHVPNAPMKLILRCLHIFLLQPLPKQKLQQFLRDQEQNTIFTDCFPIIYDSEKVAPLSDIIEDSVARQYSFGTDYIQSLKTAGSVLELLLVAVLNLHPQYVEDIRNISVSIGSSKATNHQQPPAEDLSRASTRASMVRGNSNGLLPPAASASSKSGHITLFSLLRSLYLLSVSGLEAPVTSDLMNASSALIFENLVALPRLCHLLQLHSYFIVKRSEVFQLFYEPTQSIPHPLTGETARKLTADGANGKLQNILVTVIRRMSTGLFSFPHIFVKHQLLTSFQTSREFFFSVASDDDSHSLIKELELFNWFRNQSIRLLSSTSAFIHALKQAPSTSENQIRKTDEALSSQVQESTSIWSIHVYLMVHALFQEIYQQNMETITKHKENHDSSSVSSSVHHRDAVPHPFHYSATPQKHPISSQPNQNQKIISFTPIYQSTQISILPTPPHRKLHSNQESLNKTDQNISKQPNINHFSLSQSFGTSEQKYYIEQIILSSTTPITIYLTWRMIYSTTEFISKLLITGLNFSRGFDHELSLLLENLFWFIHRTNTFSIELSNLFISYEALFHAESGTDGGKGESREQNGYQEIHESDPISREKFLLWLQEFNVQLFKKSHATIDPIPFPNTIAEFLIYLCLIVNERKSSHKPYGIQSMQTSSELLYQAMRRSMNAIIDSGVLPSIYHFLPTFLERLIFRKLSLPSAYSSSKAIQLVKVSQTEPSNEQRIINSFPILSYLLQETYLRLSQMMEPSLSEENSSDLMITMTKGLKQILMIPLQLLFFHHDPNDLLLLYSKIAEDRLMLKRDKLRRDEGGRGGERRNPKYFTITIQDLLQEKNDTDDHYRNLFLLYFQLEDLCYEKSYYPQMTTSLPDDPQNDSTHGSSAALRMDCFHLISFPSLEHHQVTILLPLLVFERPGVTADHYHDCIVGIERDYRRYLCLEKWYLYILEYSYQFQQKHASSSTGMSFSRMTLQGYIYLVSITLSLLLSSCQHLLHCLSICSEFQGMEERDIIVEMIFDGWKDYLQFLIKILKEIRKTTECNGEICDSLLSTEFPFTITKQNQTSADQLDVDETSPSSSALTSLTILALCRSLSVLGIVAVSIVPSGEAGHLSGSQSYMIHKKCVAEVITYLESLESNSEIPPEEVFQQESIAISKLLPGLASSWQNSSENLQLSIYKSIREFMIETTALISKKSLTRNDFNTTAITAVQTNHEDASISHQEESSALQKKRTFVDMADASLIQEIARHAEKKQVRQGIIPLMYNSSVDRPNRDQQSQDNHYHSFPNTQSQTWQLQFPPSRPLLVSNLSNPPSGISSQNPPPSSSIHLQFSSQPLAGEKKENRVAVEELEVKGLVVDPSRPAMLPPTSPSHQETPCTPQLESLGQLMKAIQNHYHRCQAILSDGSEEHFPEEKVAVLRSLFETSQAIQSQVFQLMLLTSRDKVEEKDEGRKET